MRIFAASCCILALTACQRERRDLRPAPDLQPGGVQPQPVVLNPVVRNPYEGTAYAISEGQRLFGWYNCAGCHANGGGGIGPPLIKDKWVYGGEPPNLFDTIVKGRPNGMPAWGGRIPEYQIWQLVTFVRSLNNQEPKSATSIRADTLEQDPHTLRPQKGGIQ